jgi:hypothetical protein
MMISNQMAVLNAAYAAANFSFTVVSTDTCVHVSQRQGVAAGASQTNALHRHTPLAPAPCPAPDPGW